MEQTTINQRLKFLVEKLATSARAFSELIGESATNTQNYIGSRQTEPRHDYLAKVVRHFSGVNAHWLLTGEGEPFIGDTPQSTYRTEISGDSNNTATGKGSKAIQKNYTINDCVHERDLFRTERDAARREIELLAGQLQTKDALIASKEETIDLLKAAFNRPN